MRYKFLLALVLFLLFTKSVQAEIFINEISAASSPEWVELYNASENEASLLEWYLDDVADKGSSPKKFSLTIPALGFGIIEVSSIFNNTGGDSVRLLDDKQKEIDCYQYSENVSAENIFLRCPDGGENWLKADQNSKEATNLNICLALTPTLISSPTSILLPTSTPTPFLTSILSLAPTAHTTPPKADRTPGVMSEVWLSEIMAYPDNESEWVEIYNNNDYQVTLENWFLDDGENSGATPKKFSISISSKSYGVIELSSNIFNNDKDTVRLLSQTQQEVDSIQYQSPVKGQSYSRQSFNNDAQWCFTEASKNAVNNNCPESSTLETKTNNATTTSGNVKNTLVQKKPTSEDNFTVIAPEKLKLNSQFYQIKPKKVLGAKTSKASENINIQFSFWRQYTKISLWVSLLLNVVLIIYLSFFLPALPLY